MNDNFTERQQAMLGDALRKRRDSATRAGLLVSGSPAKAKVSKEEYNRRMRIMLAEDARIAEQTKNERIGEAMDEWAKVVGVRFERATIEDARIERIIMEKVDRIVNHGPLHRNGIVLSGGLGVGKTWTAYAYARLLVERGALLPSSLVHGTETTLLAPLALGGFERPQRIFDFLNNNNKFYLIDDVGRTFIRSQELQHEIWYELLNHAYENHVPIALTTNKSTVNFKVPGSDRVTNELEMWIGDAAYDRLRNIADIIVPNEENKRAKVGKMMDEGKVLGLNSEQTMEEQDPFGGLSLPDPPRKASFAPPVIKRSDKELRPKRR